MNVLFSRLPLTAAALQSAAILQRLSFYFSVIEGDLIYPEDSKKSFDSIEIKVFFCPQLRLESPFLYQVVYSHVLFNLSSFSFFLLLLLFPPLINP